MRRITRGEFAVEGALAQVVLSAFPVGDGEVAPVVEAIDWPLAVKVAEDGGLAPLVYRSLQKLGLLDRAPPDVAERLRAAYLRSSVANWLAIEQLVGLLAVFEREQIPVILLKGCALAPTLYEDAALRPMTDLDILVSAGNAPRAETLLVARGFARRRDLAEGFELRFAHAQGFERPGICVDLHTHLLGDPYWCERIDVEWFWQRSVEVRVNGRPARLLSPGAQLLHLCAHLVCHHGGGRLIWLYDLTLLLARYGEETSWEEVFEAAERFGLTLALKEGLARAAEEWGARVPARASARLAAVQPNRTEHLLLQSLALPHHQTRILSIGLSRLSLREKLHYFRRQAFPSAAYMRERYGLGQTWLLPLSYLRRLAVGSYKVARFAMLLLQRVDNRGVAIRE